MTAQDPAAPPPPQQPPPPIPQQTSQTSPSQQQPPNEPPPYSSAVVSELPGNVPESRSSTSHDAPQNTSESSESARVKPEGSNYAGAYRPSDAQNIPPPITVTDHHPDFSSAHYEHMPGTSPSQAPPAYTEQPGILDDTGNQMGGQATVADDGRVNININQKDRTLSRIILPQLQRQLTQVNRDPAPPPPYIPEFLGGVPGQEPPPALNVVIQVVGSRGDVQPFVALGKVLKETYGHRVRMATHPTFKDFVTEHGLEFFSIGGDPAELMAFMVKNPGLMPGFDTLRSGEVGKRRRGIAEMLRGTWRSCIETGDGLGVDPLKQTVEEWMGVEDQLPEALKKPFVADAIIANPPSFGHIHCAEKLGIPLHMMFTMPWSPTQQFPHPLANIQSSNTDPTITNFMSYILVDMLTWQGLGDVTNRFRKECLGLDPVSMIWAPAMLARLKIPWTYCWSPALIPKPKDWANHIQISGFYFLNLASNYTPAPDLAQFLAAGEPPVYIGFGSIVVDDPNAMTKMIFDAVKMTGRRALVSKGWGGLGADDLGIPEGVFMLGNVPHDWLFKHVAAVVHHGGAGTTAAGIAAGRPTVVVPFFGDQPFWGAMTARAGAGPEPVAYKELTAEKLAESINHALKPESLDRAKELSEKISREQGSQNGAQSFHQLLRYDELRCAVVPQRPAVWRVKRTQVKLSTKAATILAQEGELNFSELKLHRPREYETDEGPWDPLTGGATALIGTGTQIMMGVADFPIETLKLLNIHPDSAKSSKGKGKAKQSTDGSSTQDKLGTGSVQDSAASSSTTLPGLATPDSSNSTEMPSPSHKNSFMAEAMASSSQVSRPSSPGGHRRLLSRDNSGFSRSRRSSTATEEQPSTQTRPAFDFRSSSNKMNARMNADSLVGTGKGIGRIVGAGFKSPMDFSMNVAKGFHNVPKLYGAEVRQVDKVTDFNSGVRTAAKFGFGMYDGITGLVTDPYKGAKKEGAVGFVKGVGRGIFSVPFRVMGGAFSVPAYAMKGLYAEMVKSKGANAQNYIIAARIAQGYDEASNVSAHERAEIVARWKSVKVDTTKKKTVGEKKMDFLHQHMENRKRQGRRDTAPGSSSQPTATRDTLAHANTYPTAPTPQQHLSADVEKEELRLMEEAIQGSIAETSRGNPEEDEVISRAIRASLAEFEREPAEHEDEDQVLERVMTASLQEAQRAGATEEEQKLLEETLRKSLLDTSARRVHGSDSEWDSDDTQEDENYQRIIDESQKLADLHRTASRDIAAQEEEELKLALRQSEQDPPAPTANEDDEMLRKAIAESEKLREREGAGGGGDADEEELLRKAMQESEQAEKQRLEELAKQRNEEDIVLEYVKKQSLAEEEHKRRVFGGRDTGGESSRGAGSGSGV
ncbi:unnamed protein product [Periconia digitata]|uniref:Glycosyltransferase family 28 N-terminal domain-containing protein n=1 Tax=Periconia digitata TaxID=1303443 RepID=A0A9W4UP68_9PLEO|nr:unnamed protein product [Periconia digitata]